MKDFRPISLCNVLHKLISKVLANRIKKVLPEIISSNQSAFIPKRLRTDNIMVAYEMLHSVKIRQKGKMGSMTIKLDMSKVYDRVECTFLEAMLIWLGFGEKISSLVMRCVSPVSYSVLVNGKAGMKLIPSRGIRQEDHLSPYLFIICTRGLSQLLLKVESQGDIRDCGVSRETKSESPFYLLMIVCCFAKPRRRNGGTYALSYKSMRVLLGRP